MKSNRDANRQQFPVCAAFIDNFRKYFVNLTVHYVREQGREKGKPMRDGKGVMRRFWTNAEIAMLRKRYANSRTKSIADELGRSERSIYAMAESLDLKKSSEYLASAAACRLRRGDEVGKEFRFGKGHVPFNKGLRRPGWAPGRMKETQFQRGQMSGAAARNYKPIGSVRIIDGNLERKVTDDSGVLARRRWRPVHRLVWEAAHGPVPYGHIVVFRVGMHTAVEDDITLDRLECISLAENMRRNTVHRYPKEIKDAMRSRAVLNRRIHHVEKYN